MLLDDIIRFLRVIKLQLSGVSVPRAGPSPRAISVGVVVNESLPNYDVSLMTMQWGQFIDHDLTLTPVASLSKKSC